MFFTDYAYVIWQTGPSGCMSYSKDERSAHTVPTGFYSRPVACKLMQIGRQYIGLYEENRLRKVRPVHSVQPISIPFRNGPRFLSPEAGKGDESGDT